MSYPWRPTQGWIDCRPSDYRHNSNFPKPKTKCNKECIYYIFCQLETSYMTLGERLREIKLITQKPYHFFTRTSDGRGIILYLEGLDRSKLEFRGNSIAEALETAEKYIEHERKMGKLKSASEKLNKK